MRFIDMFCGIGGFRLGLERANTAKQESGEVEQATSSITGQRNRRRVQPIYRCVWSNDSDKYACSIYRKHFGEVREGDIRAVDADTIPEHDLLCAGFPCQSFSIAGKRRGFEDTRGTLFFEICRILRAKRPRVLFLENVKGLLSHDEGNTFQAILQSLDELGYDLQWQVLNSKDSGVPQNRERVFIIGHSRNQPRPKVFPLREGNGLVFEEGAGLQSIRFSSLRSSDYKGTHNLIGEVANSIDANYYKGLDCHQQRSGVVLYDRIRRLTPIECERLQGFPDNWTAGISDSQRYKCLGNAVSVPVIEAIGRQLMEFNG